MASLRNLDLNLIKVFDAIYTTGSVSGAARRMGVSQPSISRGLGRLREHFDDSLFERSGNGVAPTAKAEAMLESVKSALSLLESTIDGDGFNPATDRRHFRVIIPDFVEAKAMPAVLNALPPGSKVSIEAFSLSGTVDTAIIEGEADVAIVPYLPNETDLAYRHVLSDHFVIIAREGHPAMGNGFSWPLLKQLRFVALPESVHRLGRLDEMLVTQGLSREVAYVTHKLSSYVAIVASTDLVGFHASEYAEWLKKSWPIESHEAPGLSAVKQHMYLVCSKQAESDPGVAWLCDQIEAACRDELPEYKVAAS